MDALARDVGGNDSLRSIGRVRRYWWLVLLGALLGLLAGALGTSLVAKQYSATTSVSVLGIPDAANVSGSRVNSNVNMDNELQFIRSGAVVADARKLMESPADLDVLVQQMTVTVPANTSVIDVSFVAATPEGARGGSHAFAQAYVDMRKQSVVADIELKKEALTTELAAYTKELSTYAGQVVVNPSTSPTHEVATAQVNTLQSLIGDVRAQITALNSVEDVKPAVIVDDAVAPTAPTTPIPPLYVGTGIFAGILLGLGLAVLAARLDSRVRYPQDVEQRVGRPVLAVIPRPSRGKQAGGLLSARSGSAAFDRLRLRLEASALDGAQSVLVCADRSSNGTTFVAANLAASLARAGTPAVLVAADPESSAAELLGVAEGPGLRTVLLEEDGRLETVAQEIAGRPRLRVVVPGRDLADVLERVPGTRIAALVAELVESGQHVVVEAPPVSTGTEAQELARRMGTTLVVAELGLSKVPDLRQAFEEIEFVGAFTPGAVIVPPVAIVARGVRDADRTAAETLPPMPPTVPPTRS